MRFILFHVLRCLLRGRSIRGWRPWTQRVCAWWRCPLERRRRTLRPNSLTTLSRGATTLRSPKCGSLRWGRQSGLLSSTRWPSPYPRPRAELSPGSSARMTSTPLKAEVHIFFKKPFSFLFFFNLFNLDTKLNFINFAFVSYLFIQKAEARRRSCRCCCPCWSCSSSSSWRCCWSPSCSACWPSRRSFCSPQSSYPASSVCSSTVSSNPSTTSTRRPPTTTASPATRQAVPAAPPAPPTARTSTRAETTRRRTSPTGRRPRHSSSSERGRGRQTPF